MSGYPRIARVLADDVYSIVIKQHMQNGIGSGCSALSVKCQVSNHKPVAGPGRLMDDTVWGDGIVQGVSRHVLTCMCL